MIDRVEQLTAQRPWIWALLGSVAVYITISVVTSRFGLGSLSSNASLAALLAIISLGQMFAVSSGGGGIDLSIPYVVTLTAFLSMGLTAGSNGRLIEGVLAAVGVGLLVGATNGVAILFLRIPPIIGTMGVGFILNTGILLYQSKYSAFSAAPILSSATRNDIAGIPIIVLITILLAGGSALILNRLSYGRSLLAVGQNRLAAYLAGTPVNWTILIAYMLSGLLAALGGVLVAGYVGGAFLDMGTPYLLESIGAVVIGGTLIGGGSSTSLGTLFGALFLVLIVTLMDISHLSIGGQNIVEGAVIILVLLVASNRERQ